MKKLILAAMILMVSQSFAAPSYVVTDLGPLAWATPNPRPGAQPNTIEYSASAAGEVGYLTINDPDQGPYHHAYLYRNTVLTDLGVLPGAIGVTSPPQSVGMSLNSQAHVAGFSATAYSSNVTGRPVSHAMLWNGALLDLGTLSGDPGYESVAEGVNDYDEVVGRSQIVLYSGQVTNRAFIWIAGKMYNLTYYEVGGPKFILIDATAISCQGNIAAVGFNASNPLVYHSYFLARVGTARSCP